MRHNFFGALGIPFKTRHINIVVARLVQLLQLRRLCAIRVRVAVVDVKLNTANDYRSTHGGDLLIQRHKSWAYSQPTADEDVAPLDYLQWKNKESVARWRHKVNALAAAGNYPYTTY